MKNRHILTIIIVGLLFFGASGVPIFAESTLTQTTSIISKPYGTNGNYFSVTTEGIGAQDELTGLYVYVTKGTVRYKFQATLQEDNSYKAVINISKFDYQRGMYYVSVVAENIPSYQKMLYKGAIYFAPMKANTFNVSATVSKSTIFAVNVGSITAPAGLGSIKVRVSLGSLTKWYTAKKIKEGSYQAIVNRRHFYYNKGTYILTIYGYDKNGIAQKLITSSKTFDAEAYHIFYVGDILIVNKKHILPSNYNPGENIAAGSAARQLIHDMRELGMDISTSYSGFRSYTTQTNLYNYYVSIDGRADADRYSARPGYSEHQTGLAFDIKHKSGALVTKTREKAWLSANAHKYGFIIRYLPGKESITGYQYEPWHLRYVGASATAIKNSGKTLEEYLGVVGGGY